MENLAKENSAVERFTFEIHLPPNVAILRLSQATLSDKKNDCIGKSDRQKLFKGTVLENGCFKIKRIFEGRNSFVPILKGQIRLNPSTGTSEVEVVSSLTPEVLLFSKFTDFFFKLFSIIVILSSIIWLLVRATPIYTSPIMALALLPLVYVVKRQVSQMMLSTYKEEIQTVKAQLEQLFYS